MSRAQKMSLMGMLEISMKLECLTGLRIGAAAETFEIGGVENIIVKEPITRLPYVPGSSLKGAMRAHYELYSGKPINHVVIEGNRDKPAIKIHLCKVEDENNDCEICRVFGRPCDPRYMQLDQNGNPNMVYATRLKVDDAHPTEDTRRWWEAYCPGGIEVKYENVLDRLTSHANPRQVERIPAGSEFGVMMSYKIFDEKDVDNIKVIFQALKLIEDDYLGGYGSRGYGRVRFKDISITVKTRKYYENCGDESKKTISKNSYNSVESVLKDIQQLVKEIKKEIWGEGQKH